MIALKIKISYEILVRLCELESATTYLQKMSHKKEEVEA